MKFIAILFVSLILISPPKSFGGDPYAFEKFKISQQVDAIELQRLRQSENYRNTMNMCYGDFRQFLMIYKDAFIETLNLGVFDLSAWDRLIKHDGFSPKTLALLNDPAFTQALLDCSSGRRWAQYQFAATFSFAEISGRATGGLATLLMIRYIVKGFLYLKTYGPLGRVAQGTLVAFVAAQVFQQLQMLYNDTAEVVTHHSAKIDNMSSSSKQMMAQLNNWQESTLKDIDFSIADLQTQLSQQNLSDEDMAYLKSTIRTLEAHKNILLQNH